MVATISLWGAETRTGRGVMADAFWLAVLEQPLADFLALIGKCFPGKVPFSGLEISNRYKGYIHGRSSEFLAARRKFRSGCPFSRFANI